MSALNARSSANVRPNNEVCSLPNAAETNILEISKDGKWYKVDVRKFRQCAPAKSAWVRAEPYFESLANTASGIVYAPRGLKVRTLPSSEAKVLCQLGHNFPVAIIGPVGDDEEWLKIATDDNSSCKAQVGFVPKKYIREFRNVIIEGNETPFEEEGSDTAAGFGCTTCNSEGKLIDLDILDPNLKDPIDKMIAYAQKKKSSRSTGACFRYVKNALLAGGLVNKYLSEISAKKAGNELKSEGFVNLLEDPQLKQKIKSPYDAPRGAVLVYSGGPHGHIEIKTGPVGEGGFISDYFSESARTGEPENQLSGRGRTLIGVYIKGNKS